MIAFLVYRDDHTCLLVFWCFSKFPCHLTHPCQRFTPLFNAFNISGRISSSPAVFRFQSLYGCCYFCHCEHFLFPKLNQITYVSVGVALAGFNKSLKYFLQREGISFLLRRMFPVESLMEVVVLKLFSFKW